MKLDDITRKTKVSKGIVTASYNDYGTNADDEVFKTAAKEKGLGHDFINHLIYRNKSNLKDNLKFNYLLDGVPVIAYAMMNTFKSDLEEVVFVGNSDTEKIMNLFVDFFQVNKDHERFKFAHEGEHWGFTNTVEKGVEKLNLEQGELTMLLPGDVPFLFNMDAVLKHPGVGEYDAILNLNSQQKVGHAFPRNYHLQIKDGHLIYNVKEPNVYLFDLEKIPPGVLGLFFGGRKTYTEYDENGHAQEVGRSEVIMQRFFGVENFEWKRAYEILNPRAIKTLGTLSTKIWQFAKVKYNLMNKDNFTVSLKQANGLASTGLDAKAMIDVSNEDPGSLEDMDSLEDWAYMSAMIQSGGEKIYPFYNEMKIFENEAMPEIKEECDIIDNFPAFINSRFEKFGLTRPSKNSEYKHHYYEGGAPLLQASPYKLNTSSFDPNNELQLIFTMGHVKDMIKMNNVVHQAYVRKVFPLIESKIDPIYQESVKQQLFGV